MRALTLVLVACGSDPVHHLADAGVDAFAIDDAPPPDAGCVTGFDDGTGLVPMSVVGNVTLPSAGTLTLCPSVYSASITATHDLTIAGSDAANTIIDGGNAGTPLIVTGAITVTAHDVSFVDGLATQTFATLTAGGDVYCDGATLNLSHVVVSGGHAQEGGGVFALGCTASISDTTLTTNTGTSDGGGFMSINAGSASFTRVTATMNTTQGDGGGIAILLGSTADLADSTITTNTAAADDGAGVYLEDVVTCTNTTITGNTGDGVFVAGNTARYTSTTCTYGSNTPDDVGTSAGSGFEFGSAASFTCTSAGCD